MGEGAGVLPGPTEPLQDWDPALPVPCLLSEPPREGPGTHPGESALPIGSMV